MFSSISKAREVSSPDKEEEERAWMSTNKEPIIVTVFFEGTANPLDSFVTQIGLFSTLTEAIDLKGEQAVTSYEAGRHYKISFDGCGVTNGMMGTLFATGLSTQCHEVKRHIVKMITSSNNSKDTPRVKINAVGLSRGGVAAIQLAQVLYNIPPEHLEVNLLLFDPVPGNLITSSRFMDWIGVNTANSALDLSYCRNLCNVLALYPFQPLPDYAFHAPVLPKYPDKDSSQCVVEEDACLGCHQGALFCTSRSIECRLSYVRIHEWLLDNGTRLQKHDGSEMSATALGERLFMSPSECKIMMDSVLACPDKEVAAIVRYAHSSPAGATITMNSLSPTDYQLGMQPLYLNKYHRRLSKTLKKANSDSNKEFGEDKLFLEIYRPPSMWSGLSSTSKA